MGKQDDKNDADAQADAVPERGFAGVAAEEATGQIPVGRLRKEILPEGEQGSSEAHEPYGAEDDQRKEKGRA